MKSVYKNSSFSEGTITKKYPVGFKTSEIQEKTIVVNNDLIKGENKEVLLDGIKINIRSGVLNSPLVVDVEHDFPFLKIHFEIEGGSNYIPKNNQSIAVDIPGGHYNFFFLPKVKGTLRYNNPNRKTLEIVFTKEYLKRVFGQSFKESSSKFGEALEKNVSFLMWNQSKPITSQLRIIIEEIINCKFKGGIKKAYLESKITEILAFFFDNLKYKEDTPEQNLNKEDYLKILNAENFIKEHIKDPITIQDIALITGINQHKLKRNFKLIFGKPIFSYLTEIRMEKAKKMIIEKGYTVTEASYEVGYKNPQHFTAAFKRKYNYLPSSLKNSI